MKITVHKLGETDKRTYDIRGWLSSNIAFYENEYYAEDIYHDGRLNILKFRGWTHDNEGHRGQPIWETVEEDVFETTEGEDE